MNNRDRDYISDLQDLQNFHNLKVLVGEVLDMLESVELSDNERSFHPTIITSCRAKYATKLEEIMPQITRIVRGEYYKEFESRKLVDMMEVHENDSLHYK